MKSHTFHLGDVLAVITGRPLAPRGMEGVYDLLCFMTQDNLLTHQLPRARRECAACLLRQHPQLAGVRLPPIITPANLEDVLDVLCADYGEYLTVSPLPAHVCEHSESTSDLTGKAHSDQVIKGAFRRPKKNE